MKAVHFHFVYTFKYIKYAVILALLPFLSLLLRADWDGVRAAFLQDAVIVTVVALVAFFFWRASSCKWNSNSVEVQAGPIVKTQYIFNSANISVIEIQRPLYCRILGASIVLLYSKGAFPIRKRKIYLPKAAAQQLCDTLLPKASTSDISYRATGADRFLMVLLSANVITSTIIVFFTYRQIADFLGERTTLLFEWAVTGILSLEQVFETLLPAGAALLASLLTLLTFVTLLRSLQHTHNYTVHRYNNILVQQLGMFNKVERRIMLNEINYCDVRYSPMARIFNRFPVFISAGAYSGTDTPFFLCKSEQDPTLRKLLPGYTANSNDPLSNRGNRSVLQFVWLSAFALFIFGLLFLTALRIMPGIVPLLSIPLLFSVGTSVAQLEAYFTEGAAANAAGGIRAQYTRFFTKHSVLVFPGQVALHLHQNPISILRGACRLSIKTPCGTNIKVRGVGFVTAVDMRFAHKPTELSI